MQATNAGQSPASTRVIVVRHAEDLSEGGPNTDLDPDTSSEGVGVSRAQRLARLAAQSGVTAIYTTETCRTAQTIQPAARALGLTIRVLRDDLQRMNLSGCTPSITVQQEYIDIRYNDADGLARTVREEHAGTTILVAGHSGTVPQIVEALSGESLCPRLFEPVDTKCAIPETQFGDLFVVTIPREGQPQLDLDSF